MSVRLYGMSKREFGFPRSHLIARMPLSLPDKFILNVIRMLTVLTTRNLIVKVSVGRSVKFLAFLLEPGTLRTLLCTGS